MTVKGQNLFFYGEQSFPCTEAVSLKANSGDQIKDLNVLFAKHGKQALFIINTEVENLLIRNKLIIYLNDGNVIGLDDEEYYDYVDNTATTLYTLNKEDLNKLKNSNIHTIRFRLEGEDDLATYLFEGGSFTASNKGNRYDFPALITEFFEDKINNTVEHRGEITRPLQQIDDKGNSQGVTFPGGNQGVPTGDPNARNYGQGGNGSGDQGSGVSFGLAGRFVISMPKPKYPGNDSGVVVVKITVDKNGRVTDAEPGVRGTTIMDQSFWNEAKQTALKARFNVSETAPAFQQGTISYRFVLD